LEHLFQGRIAKMVRPFSFQFLLGVAGAGPISIWDGSRFILFDTDLFCSREASFLDGMGLTACLELQPRIDQY